MNINKEKKRYAKGPTERLDLIADFAYKVLPEKISEKAVPSENQLKRLPITLILQNMHDRFH